MTRRTRQELLRFSLEDKWNKTSGSDLDNMCPFCHDAAVAARVAIADSEDDFTCVQDEREIMCEYCQCPQEICADHARKGFIHYLKSKYLDDQVVCSIGINDLNSMILLFEWFKEH